MVNQLLTDQKDGLLVVYHSLIIQWIHLNLKGRKAGKIQVCTEQCITHIRGICLAFGQDDIDKWITLSEKHGPHPHTT